MSYEEFLKITSVLEKNYDKRYDKGILKIWYHELKQHSGNQYKKIVLEAIKNYKFQPTLAEILAIEVLPEWIDKKIERKEATKEQQAELEELLRKYK